MKNTFKSLLESVLGKDVANDISILREELCGNTAMQAFMEAASEIVDPALLESIVDAHNALYEYQYRRNIRHDDYHRMGGSGEPVGYLPQLRPYNHTYAPRTQRPDVAAYERAPEYRGHVITPVQQPRYDYVEQPQPRAYVNVHGVQPLPPPPPPPQPVQQAPEQSPAPQAVRQQSKPSTLTKEQRRQKAWDDAFKRNTTDFEREIYARTGKTPKELRQAKMNKKYAQKNDDEVISLTEPLNKQKPTEEKKPVAQTKPSAPAKKKDVAVASSNDSDFSPVNGTPQCSANDYNVVIHVASFNSDSKEKAIEFANQLINAGVKGVYCYQLNGKGKNSTRENVWRVRVGNFKTKNAAAAYANSTIKPITGKGKFVVSDRKDPNPVKGWWLDSCTNDNVLNVAELKSQQGEAKPTAGQNEGNVSASNQEQCPVPPKCPEGESSSQGVQPAPDAQQDQNVEQSTPASVEGDDEFNKYISTVNYHEEFNIEKDVNLLLSQGGASHKEINKMKKYLIKMIYKYFKYKEFIAYCKENLPGKAYRELYGGGLISGLSSITASHIIDDMADEIQDGAEHLQDFVNGDIGGGILTDSADEDFYQCVEQFSEELDNAYEGIEDMFDELSSSECNKIAESIGARTAAEAQEKLKNLFLNTYELWPFYTDGNISVHVKNPDDGDYLDCDEEAPNNVRLHDNASAYLNQSEHNTVNQLKNAEDKTAYNDYQGKVNSGASPEELREFLRQHAEIAPALKTFAKTAGITDNDKVRALANAVVLKTDEQKKAWEDTLDNFSKSRVEKVQGYKTTTTNNNYEASLAEIKKLQGYHKEAKSNIQSSNAKALLSILPKMVETSENIDRLGSEKESPTQQPAQQQSTGGI